jgi:hypothetical protein
VFSELMRENIATGEVEVGEDIIPITARGELADELAKIRTGDAVHFRGTILSHDTKRVEHRGGMPYLQIEITEIVQGIPRQLTHSTS